MDRKRETHQEARPEGPAIAELVIELMQRDELSSDEVPTPIRAGSQP